MIRRIFWLLLLMTAIAASLIAIQGAGTQLSGNQPQPPICPSCRVLSSSIVEASISDILDKNPNLTAGYLAIPTSYVPKGNVEFARFEIVSAGGKRVFVSDEGSATVEDAYVLIRLPERKAKAAQRQFKRGNTLRIALKIRREDPGAQEKPKDDKPKDEKYK